MESSTRRDTPVTCGQVEENEPITTVKDKRFITDQNTKNHCGSEGGVIMQRTQGSRAGKA